MRERDLCCLRPGALPGGSPREASCGAALKRGTAERAPEAICRELLLEVRWLREDGWSETVAWSRGLGGLTFEGCTEASDDMEDSR